MANTYSQIYVQVVFAVKHREALIEKSWRPRLFQYITGILQQKGQKMLAIGGVEDHIHLFFGYDTLTLTIPELVAEIKKSSNKFIKENRLTPHLFAWQEGYGAFSYSQSHIDRVCKYVLNQEAHHKKVTFKEEYLGFLDKFQIEYDKRYVFNFFQLETCDS